MRGGFFEGFEECVECSGREHMYFIDDIDLVFSLIRFEPCFLDEITDILDTIVARAIDLDTVEHGTILERSTMLTLMTWISILNVCTIHSLCKDTSTRCLTRSTRSMEEIGMSDAISLEAISEYSRDVVLADDRVPVFWAIFGIERHAHTI